MKKIFITDLETEKRNELIKKNERLADKLQSDLYESQMQMQYIDSKNIMNDEALKAIEYHEHYNSFFYTLKDWKKFINNIDIMYLSDDACETYKNIMKKIDKLNELDPYSDEFYDLDSELEEQTKILLKNIEKYLHNYETFPSQDEAIQYADEMEQLEGYYIEEREDGTTDGVIRKDISFTECYI